MAAEQPRRAGRWVLWGVGSPLPEDFFDIETHEQAADIAREADPEWADDPGGWSVVVAADEDELRQWMDAHDSGRGYAPYEPSEPASEHHKLEEKRPY